MPATWVQSADGKYTMLLSAGSGLCLGPATAELVMHHLLGSQLQQETTGVDDKSLALAAAELLPENCMKRLAQ